MKKKKTFEITDNLGCLDAFVHPDEIEIISPFAERILSRLTLLPSADRIGQDHKKRDSTGGGK